MTKIDQPVLYLTSGEADDVRRTLLLAIEQNVALDRADAARRNDTLYYVARDGWDVETLAYSELTKDLAVAYQRLTDPQAATKSASVLPLIVDEILR